MQYMQNNSHRDPSIICKFIDGLVDFYREIYGECCFKEIDITFITNVLYLNKADEKLIRWHLMSSERPFDITYSRRGGSYHIYLNAPNDVVRFSDLYMFFEECIVEDDGLKKTVNLLANSVASHKMFFIVDTCVDTFNEYRTTVTFPTHVDFMVSGITLNELYTFINTCIDTYTNVIPFQKYSMEIDFVDIYGIPDKDWYYFNYIYGTFNLVSSSGLYELKPLKKNQFKLRRKK